MYLIDLITGNTTAAFLRKARTIVSQVNALEDKMQSLTDLEIPEMTQQFRDRYQAGETLDQLLPEAFALCREASRRSMNMRHFDVQIIGGYALHTGNLAEMRTGEGKTLVATLPAYLNSLSGKGVHVITVNDYLARRDCQWMGPIFATLGVSVGVINDNFKSFQFDPNHHDLDDQLEEQGDYKIFEPYMRPVSKRDAYACDITYGTNSQFGFDYLRDNTVHFPNQLVQRGHEYAIVDEVDSILIDEARVPLILSTASDEASDIYRKFAQLATILQKDADFTVDEKHHAIQMTNDGLDKAERYLGVENLYTPQNIRLAHHLENAVRAQALYIRDKEYLVNNGEIMIVDQFTGRVQEGRRWSDGLHQAIEAKEGVEVKQETRTLASITYQNYFKFYKKLSGMTGTGKTSEEEFHKVYNLDVHPIPTNRPVRRIDNVDLIYINEEAKWRAIAEKVKDLNQKGQPVLIGTVSVEKNELLSLFLNQQGIKHVLLNAKNHENEGQVIAEGGRRGSVTVATNMAGRGIDIKLGGADATPEEAQEIRDLGGLFVIGTERHEARRIDNQLRGRSGRQGDLGETQFFVSLDDHLMRVFGSERVKNMMKTLKMPEDMPIQHRMISRNLEKAQEKIEGFNFDARKHVLSYDDVLSKHRKVVYARRGKILLRDAEYINELWRTEVLNRSGERVDTLNSQRADIDDEIFVELFARVALQSIDRLWMEHLEIMDQARRGVGLRAYGQREPLVEYAKEALRLYRELEGVFYNDLITFFLNIDTSSIGQTIVAEDEEVLGDDEEKKVIDGEYITIIKDGETRHIKTKKSAQWIEAGWNVVEAGKK
jgi:preprotein translocase subunit SecA